MELARHPAHLATANAPGWGLSGRDRGVRPRTQAISRSATSRHGASHERWTRALAGNEPRALDKALASVAHTERPRSRGVGGYLPTGEFGARSERAGTRGGRGSPAHWATHARALARPSGLSARRGNQTIRLQRAARRSRSLRTLIRREAPRGPAQSQSPRLVQPVRASPGAGSPGRVAPGRYQRCVGFGLAARAGLPPESSGPRYSSDA